MTIAQRRQILRSISNEAQLANRYWNQFNLGKDDPRQGAVDRDLTTIHDYLRQLNNICGVDAEVLNGR